MKIQNILAALLIIFVPLAANGESTKGVQAEQKFARFSKCKLESGEAIAPCNIGYRTFGMLNEQGNNAILVPTWFTGNSSNHSYLATKEILDPGKYFVVIVDALGNGVSSSPSNSNTQSNGAFPSYGIVDMVDSQYRLLTETLGIKKLFAVVGLSMGGMQAFEWSVRYPEFMTKTIAIIGTPRLPSFDIALWETRNRLLALYRNCKCEEALQVLAGIGMLGNMPKTLAKNTQPKDVIASIAQRVDGFAMSLGKSWDQQTQSQAMIEHNIARHLNNDLQRAAKIIKSDVLIIVGKDDRVVTPEPALSFAPLIEAQTLVMNNGCGHGEPGVPPKHWQNLSVSFYKNRAQAPQ